MEDVGEGTTHVIPARLEHEMRLVEEAIAMVASGGAPRVIVAGIRFGEPLLDPARRRALLAGVRVRPLWRADETGVDISVERLVE